MLSPWDYLHEVIFSETSTKLFVSLSPVFIGLILGISLIITAKTLLLLFNREPIPVSHKIATVGLPGVGKTTLITAMFELIQQGFPVQRIRLHGASTIRTVNQNIACLNSGESIGPTKEKDTFIFRFSYLKGAPWLRRLFDVEIADFPGEFSDRISNVDAPPPVDLEYTLLNREFFSWIASSREYLFLVDLSAIYSQENVRSAIAHLTARIRSSWQVIEDATSERGLGTAQNRSVRIIVTKVDCLIPAYESGCSLADLVYTDQHESAEQRSKVHEVKERITMQGSISDLSKRNQIPQDFLDKLTMENNYYFSDILKFFSSRVRNSNVIYVSMSLQEASGRRLGVPRVLESVLP